MIFIRSDSAEDPTGILGTALFYHVKGINEDPVR